MDKRQEPEKYPHEFEQSVNLFVKFNNSWHYTDICINPPNGDLTGWHLWMTFHGPDAMSRAENYIMQDELEEYS